MPPFVFLALVATVSFAAALTGFLVGARISRANVRGRFAVCSDPTCPNFGPAVPIN